MQERSERGPERSAWQRRPDAFIPRGDDASGPAPTPFVPADDAHSRRRRRPAAVPTDSSTEALHRPVDLGIATLWENAHVVAVDKPSGLPVIPERYHPDARTLENGVWDLLWARTGREASLRDRTRPLLVHRIDRDTSGLVLFAKTLVGQQNLTRQFMDHRVDKRYWAIVEGTPTEDHGEIIYAIGPHPKPNHGNRGRMFVSGGTSEAPRWPRGDPRGRHFLYPLHHSASHAHFPSPGTDEPSTSEDRLAVGVPGAKPARTTWRVLERFDRFSLLEVQPHTGRTHQIRVHLAAIGHPLCVDPLYGGRAQLTEKDLMGSAPLGFAAPVRLGRVALHAKQLTFVPPEADAQASVTVESPLAADMAALLERLRKG